MEYYNIVAKMISISLLEYNPYDLQMIRAF